MNESFRAVTDKAIPKKRQGLIYYAMLNKQDSAPHVIKACEKAIDEICIDEYDKKMLREFVSTDITPVAITLKYHCSQRKLEYLFHAYKKKTYEILEKK